MVKVNVDWFYIKKLMSIDRIEWIVEKAEKEIVEYLSSTKCLFQFIYLSCYYLQLLCLSIIQLLVVESESLFNLTIDLQQKKYFSSLLKMIYPIIQKSYVSSLWMKNLIMFWKKGVSLNFFEPYFVFGIRRCDMGNWWGRNVSPGQGVLW